MLHLYLLIVWLGTPAMADPVANAEYFRLQSEMISLADRNAWTGVEKAFRACATLQPKLTFEDYLLGAFSAQATGDIHQTRERLWSAHQIKEDKTVIDWLWNIDTQYVQIRIRTNRDETLTYTGHDFYPQMPKLLKKAQETLNLTSQFQGYLLPGTYQVGNRTFDVDFDVFDQQIDTRMLDSMGYPQKVSQR